MAKGLRNQYGDLFIIISAIVHATGGKGHRWLVPPKQGAGVTAISETYVG